MKAKNRINLLYEPLTCRFEENLPSHPLDEHSTELTEITTSYKVQWLLVEMCSEVSGAQVCMRSLNCRGRKLIKEQMHFDLSSSSSVVAW